MNRKVRMVPLQIGSILYLEAGRQMDQASRIQPYANKLLIVLSRYRR